MASPISIPRLGWNMDQGVFIGWLKNEGDPVSVDDPLFTLEGEKATEDIASLNRGTLRILPGGPKAGDTIAVGAVIGHLMADGESAPAMPAATERERLVGQPTVEKKLAAVSTRLARTHHTGPIASPRARRVAEELGVDWTKVNGSGRTGRIRERDVRAAATAGPDKTLSFTRRKIAARLQESLRDSVPVTLITTADAAHLVELQCQFQAVSQSGGSPAPTYTDFLVKLTALALQQHPQLNSLIDGERIQVCNAIHIGIAVDAEAGLLVPVIRDVPGLSLKELAGRSRDLVARARHGRLSAKEMQGGTFTVSNLGGFGIDAFTPILNPPQCAILGIGRIQRRPVVRDEQIVARDEITLSLTFDHRSVDGAPAARFLQTLRERVENPAPWLIP